MKRGGRDRGRIQVALVALVGLAVLAGLAFWLLRAGRAFDLEAAQRAARGRDVVLLTLDTTRIDRLGCYGYSRATSPAINRLAAEGWRFETAYASAPVTLPSHTSILTGMYPMAHGVRNNARYRLRDDVKTLAESLRDGGYQTAAFLSALVLESRHGLNQGFDFYGDDVAGHDAENRFAIGQRPAPAVVDEALAWFRDRDPNRPAFVWLHFFDPHHPLTPPADLVEQFGTSDDDLYDAEIRVMDDAIARLRAEIDDLGVDPIWAIVSDHGEGLGDHREPGHGSFVYDTTMRAALVLKASGVFRPRVPDRVARQIDVMPTLLDLLDLPIPDDLDGVSLLRPVDESAPDEAYLEAMLGYEDYGWSPVYGLVRLPWKYVEAPRPELYNIEEDPGELRNLVDREAELVLDPCLQFPPPPVSDSGARAPYLAVYGHSFPDWFAAAVRDWAERAGRKIVSIGYRNDWADEHRIEAGPEEFSALIAHADSVATNFFHGCVFALHHRRPFVCAPSAYRFNKVRDLTRTLVAERHLVSEETPQAVYAELLGSELDPAIGVRIEELRGHSGRYVRSILG